MSTPLCRACSETSQALDYETPEYPLKTPHGAHPARHAWPGFGRALGDFIHCVLVFSKVSTNHRDWQTKLLHGLLRVGPSQVKALSSRLSLGPGIFGSHLGCRRREVQGLGLGASGPSLGAESRHGHGGFKAFSFRAREGF